jgi:hypothetical protein
MAQTNFEITTQYRRQQRARDAVSGPGALVITTTMATTKEQLAGSSTNGGGMQQRLEGGAHLQEQESHGKQKRVQSHVAPIIPSSATSTSREVTPPSSSRKPQDPQQQKQTNPTTTVSASVAAAAVCLHINQCRSEILQASRLKIKHPKESIRRCLLLAGLEDRQATHKTMQARVRYTVSKLLRQQNEERIANIPADIHTTRTRSDDSNDDDYCDCEDDVSVLTDKNVYHGGLYDR